jgi:hypothetical protein
MNNSLQFSSIAYLHIHTSVHQYGFFKKLIFFFINKTRLPDGGAVLV